MDDRDILARVGELVAEERALRERSVGHGLQEEERTRLTDVEVRPDQCPLSTRAAALSSR